MDEELIAQWSLSDRATERIASVFARKIASGQFACWVPLPGNEATADDYNVSTRTVIRAKQLLARQGTARKINGVYVVTSNEGRQQGGAT